MKAALDAAIKHGAPRGSMELAKLAEAAEAHRKVCEGMARYLRVLLVAADAKVTLDETVIAQAWTALVNWEVQ